MSVGNLSAFSERVGKILACSLFLFFFGEDTAKNYLVTHPWFLDVWDFPRSALRPLGVSASMPGLSIWRKTSWGLFRNRPDRRMDAKKVQRLPTEMASKPPLPHSPGRRGLRGVVPNRVTVREVREREVHSRLWGKARGWWVTQSITARAISPEIKAAAPITRSHQQHSTSSRHSAASRLQIHH